MAKQLSTVLALQVSFEAKLQASAKFNLDLEKPLLALCPVAKATAEQWPVQYYAEVATCKVKEGWQVALFGLENNRHVADKINQLAGNICNNLVGQTELQEVVDCLACADTVVTQDCALTPIAKALHKNMIVIHGETAKTTVVEVLQNIEGKR